jgi:DNA (cytosine-5)-methyltransferase 1
MSAKIPSDSMIPPKAVEGHTAALDYLAAARKHRTQAEIAQHLGVDVRTVRRWEAREQLPKAYVAHALQRLLPIQLPITPSADFDFIDLFAGIGGMRLPFEEINGGCVFTSEWDKYARKTYSENFANGHSIAGDIKSVCEDDVPDHDLLLAGFPCQPFSIAGVSKKNALGHKHGFADLTQGTLFFDVARIIAKKRPRAFLLENVKNLLSHDGGRTFEIILRTLKDELGYDVHVRVVDGAHFVPQHRERIRDSTAFDWNVLNLPEKKTHSLGEILHGVEGTEPDLPWDQGRFFDHAAQKVVSKYILTPNLWAYLKAYKKKHEARGNGFGFGLVSSKHVARTLSARYYKDGSEILIDRGRKAPRRLTPRECARLMGFPDTFRIPVSDTQAYKQFGNSVVVPVLREVARVMKPFICRADDGQAELAISTS